MLLERETELRLIGAGIAALAVGEGSVVLVEGPPGIGNRALLDGAA